MLTEKGPLEPRVVAEVGRQVADGLAAAHAAGVVHRDVKPGNVLIAEDGRVKLTDFGVSRAVDDVQLTRTGLIAGTPAFLSPEVARGKEPTAGSDVFALGATLYAAVEGRPPFGLDENAYALLHKVATGTVDPPHQAGPLTALLMRLLSDDPTQRPTASEARDGLADIAEGRAPAGGTPSTGTALLDMSPVAAAGAGRTADADPSPEQVATAAALPPAPPPPVRPADPGARRRGRRHGGRSPPPAPDRPGGGAGRRARCARGGTDPRRRWGFRDADGHRRRHRDGRPRSRGTAGRHDERGPGHHDRSRPPRPQSRPPPRETTTTTSTDSSPVTDPVGFVQGYYGLLPGNTDAAWALLGPTAQSQSGGRSGFDALLRRAVAGVGGEPARVGGNTVTATIVFTHEERRRSAARTTGSSSGTQDGRQVIESFSH